MANSEQPDEFRLLLNCVDFYQAVPSSLDAHLFGSSSQRNLPQVPVIRVFGATETGQKVCAHIHGAFPYLYLPYTESLAASHVDEYISTLRRAIDHALALSYRRNAYENDPQKNAFIAHISLVKGVPFFGYNVGYAHYLKVYLLNPLHMTRFADLLQRGAVLARVFQPYEAHLQYLLQWMCDFNLYGCAYIRTSKPRFRQPVPIWEEMEDLAHLWHDRSVSPHAILPEAEFPRQSHCAIELDICVQDILNRDEISARPLHHSFIERLSSLENLPPEEKLVHSMAGLWKDETKRRKMRMGITDPGSSPFPPEVLVSMSADPRNEGEGGWIHEEEYRQLVEHLAEQESKITARDLRFETFVKTRPEEATVNTALESVVDLFPETLKGRCGKTQEKSQEDVDFQPQRGLKHEDTLVDMSSIAQAGQEEANYESDEEKAKEIAMTQSINVGHKPTMGDASGEADLEGGGLEDLRAQTDASNDAKRRHPAEVEGPMKRLKLDRNGNEHRPGRVAFKVQGIDSKNAQELPKTFARRDASPPPPSGQQPRPRASSIDHGPSLENLSQSSQRSKLNFPVVKNPFDPATAQRLSQRSELSGSQVSPDKSKAKNDLQTIHVPYVRAVTPSNESEISPNGTSIHSDSRNTAADTGKSARLASHYAASFNLAPDNDVFIFGVMPPTAEVVETTMLNHGTLPVIYQDAYYSDEKDVPERPREYAGQEFKLESTTVPYLPLFDRTGVGVASRGQRAPILLDRAEEESIHERRRRQCSARCWEISQLPPAFEEVRDWLDSQRPFGDVDGLHDDSALRPTSRLWRKNPPPAGTANISQIGGPTQKNRHGFKYSQRKASTSVQHQAQYMSTMSLEVHINSRNDLAPDPERDEVGMVVWCIADEQKEDNQPTTGIVLLSRQDDLAKRVQKMVGHSVEVVEEDDELDLINRMVEIVRTYDPDILTGYEVHNSSWGYLIERARLKYEFNLPDEFSRMKSQSHGRFGKDADKWGFTHTSTVRITGRHTINIWRAMRSELNLLQYTMENVVFHLLHRRIPHYAFATLTKWFRSKRPRDLAKAVDYFVSRAKMDLEILDANELIPRTSEQARLLGVDFFSVFSRGSQFKVESLMFRIAKPESFILVSPSRKQVGAQNALECLPLVMEPQSAFYNSPLLVLDFQSLYPSVMIAYNYCYSTCLGRIANWRGTNKLGFSDFKRTPGLLELVKDKINISPNGMMYVKPEMRKSLLAKMLGEILETRVMVKSGMKADRDDKTLQQLLNNRQLALKLIANVTYGYTSASFSGRMPCSEIADSIVQTGRETLEKAIALIHSVERWGAEVVYGDTDSLFVYLKGRTRAEAFKIGDEIAKAVTDRNPRPVKLKFEKVYHPCVLLAKKRYVGFKYESLSQTEPDFDAKGIETVRRDGTPAEQKIEEKALKLLFKTADLSQVKAYFQKQCTKIMSGRFSVQDFCFAKEVKLGTYAEKGPPPPGALIATKRMLVDPRMEPQYGERVPYVVIAGAPGARLFERCVEPERLLFDEFAELDAEYYISKNLIPPLERIFNLVGANVRSWYDEMSKVQRVRLLGGRKEDDGSGKGKRTMESYMATSACLVCRTKLEAPSAGAVEVPLPLCGSCIADAQNALLTLRSKVRKAEKRVRGLESVCRSCANVALDEEVKCDSRDCPVFYSRTKAQTHLGGVKGGLEKVIRALEEQEAEKELAW